MTAALAWGVLVPQAASASATSFSMTFRAHVKNSAYTFEGFANAFTFTVVLVRRAGSVRPREMVGNWLYGVAHQTALKARAMLAKRRTKERQVTDVPETAAPAPEIPAAEVPAAEAPGTEGEAKG